MPTKKLIVIFAVSIPLFVMHGIEEFVTHFYAIDAQNQAVFGLLNSLNVHGATFVVFQVMLWLLLIVSLLLLIGKRAQLYTLAFAGVIYLYELHHLYSAISLGSYYPGLLTSLFFPIIAYFFWKEWFRNFQKSSSNL